MYESNPCVQTPPNAPPSSIKVTDTPLLAALSAAEKPAGPPPATTTSHSRVTGRECSDSKM